MKITPQEQLFLSNPKPLKKLRFSDMYYAYSNIRKSIVSGYPTGYSNEEFEITMCEKGGFSMSFNAPLNCLFDSSEGITKELTK